MTDASLLSGPADATASPAAGRTEPFPCESVVTVVADVARPSGMSGSSVRGLPWRSFFLPWLLPLGLLLVWQFLSATGIVSTAIVPAPSDIWDAARQLSERGELQHDVLVSLRRVAIGFSIGALGGLLFGLAVGLFELLHDLFDRSLQMIRTIPHLALVPLMILWFGIGEEPRLILVAMGSLFPVYINTVGGIRNVDPKLIELGRSYGLGRAELVWSIILPAALQPILVGMRYALGVAWLTLVVGETIASRDGVGYLVQNARELLRIDIIVLAIILYAIAGWLSDLVTRVIERRLLRWHPNYADRLKA
ncbi:ABC transporter permease subunit [Bradyrhizobium sp. 61]|uniref:ABC transporter permease subunit n=1 Tax=unclassified Bradyrhizobium TaxID=2631580 RepID=UPI001FFB4072|nr:MULTISPECIES: ABC transporter permease subunit [unclassified Bradyrhizobium]MCK1274605.1 ABC transporter permease subunit [Bradyrhizobium sp. 61]MCK1441599.1 ABC transporter permease subunit [Bradyrhizobium sp. 48]MCK1465689.1 ABC transporter permease subunit [Bradyrhizobium sp. 2]